ncbi:hypothetical protein CBR_g19368 [Chara braunii]|uniref:Reverse transcriptase domain-containing protein n=1 Tax=Chara braunii TaxID=69332 RepID=A0A388KXS8_CHABU|nr:hypothetical protein CBR_g19368 [Chara braunii]|eukprot:GBG74855.1 hypothetical protein CBR_g19368 [Chara braunii]
MLLRSQTAVMDQRPGEADEACRAWMLAWSTETKKRADDAAAATKKKAEDAEQARLLALEQQRQHDEAAARAADEERNQRREKIFSGERTLLTMAAEWRTEAENGKLEDCENKIALLLSHLTYLLATCITQQEDIHSLDGSPAKLQNRVQQLEQRPVAAPDASSSTTSDRLEALEMHVGSLQDGAQLQQTATQQLQQRICTTANTSSSEPRETAPKFDGLEIFCDSIKTDPIPWFRKFELTPQLHNVKEHKHHAYLYSRSEGAYEVVVGGILAYTTKVAREFRTQRYDDNNAPLMYVRIQVGQASCSALLDSGASRNFMSQSFMQRASLAAQVRRKANPTAIKVADGKTQQLLDRHIEVVPVIFAPHACEPVTFDILDKDFDIILGMPWLASANHTVNFHRRTLSLNAQTVKNAGPLPRIDDLLERLGGAKYFSKLDLRSGYHQISIRPNDRYKSTFKTRYGHFEWVVMPFGLTNAPTTFQAAMTNEFRAMLDRFVLVYLDDILVYSWSLEDHLGHLRRVLEMLRRAKDKANHDKCEFVWQELEYLGHFVTPEGISPLSDKIQAIQEWPEPRNVTDVRSFLGLAGYFQCFIKGYSKIAAHLTKLQCEDRSFDFGEEARESFMALKAALLSAEVLRIYDPLLPTRVTTDASGYGIGAVLEQHDGVDWHPVEYFSKKVSVVHSIDDARKKEFFRPRAQEVAALPPWSKPISMEDGEGRRGEGGGGGRRCEAVGYGGREKEVEEEEVRGGWLWRTGEEDGGERRCEVVGYGGRVKKMEEEEDGGGRRGEVVGYGGWVKEVEEEEGAGWLAMEDG